MANSPKIGKAHAAALLIPEPTDEEFQALKNDIDANGQREPVLITPTGELLDGRSRHRACQELGIETKARVYDGEDHFPLVFSLILGDLEGALKSFAWFEAAFPNSLDDAPQTLCWSLALYRVGEDRKAREMLWRTMFANLYVIPRLLGMEVIRHDISHGSNLEEPSHLNWIPEEYWALWTDEDRDWARALWESEEFREARRRYIELGHALKSLGRGPERHAVIEEMRRLECAHP